MALDEGKELGNYINEVLKYPLLTAEEEQELVLEKLNGNKEAREKLINCNLALVLSIAKKYFYSCQHLKPLDIIQVGNMGLIHAVDNYVLGVGRLSTFAFPTIRGYILKAKRDTDDMIKLSGSMSGLINKVLTCISKKELSYNDALDPEVLQKKFGISKVYAEECIRCFKFHTIDTYNRGLTDESESDFIDFIPEEKSEINDLIHAHDDILLLASLKYRLNMCDYFILYYNSLVDDNDKKTLMEISKMIGVTRARVSQLKDGVIKLLKKHYLTFGGFDKMLSELNKLGNFSIDKYNVQPVKIDDLVKYAILSKELSIKERSLFKLEHFSVINYDYLEICQMLEISFEEYLMIKENLVRLLSSININDYSEFVSSLKLNVFNLSELEKLSKIAGGFEKRKKI